MNAENEIRATTAPRLISTAGATIDDVQSLVLASEGMVVCRFKTIHILSAVFTLRPSCYVFSMPTILKAMVVIARTCIYFLSTF